MRPGPGGMCSHAGSMTRRSRPGIEPLQLLPSFQLFVDFAVPLPYYLIGFTMNGEPRTTSRPDAHTGLSRGGRLTDVSGGDLVSTEVVGEDKRAEVPSSLVNPIGKQN